MSTIIGKPESYFKNPKLINNPEVKDIEDIKSNNFTLLRYKPIKVRNKEEEQLKSFVIQHPIFVKDKLTDHEISNKINKLFNKNLYMVTNVGTKSDTSMVSNMILMRNFELENLRSKSKK